MIRRTRGLIGFSLASSSSLSRSACVRTCRAVSGLCSLVMRLSGSISSCSSRWLLIIGFGGVVSSCRCCPSVTVIVSLGHSARISSYKGQKVVVSRLSSYRETIAPFVAIHIWTYFYVLSSRVPKKFFFVSLCQHEFTSQFRHINIFRLVLQYDIR